MAVEITLADLQSPALAQLVAAHNRYCSATAPAESCHHLTVEELAEQGVTLWIAHVDGAPMGMGGLKALSDTEGEVKSMHTLAAARGQGVARALLAAILAEARARGYRSLWLETGAMEEFAVARRLYERTGFAACPPFGDYKADPLSVFYSLALEGVAV